MDVSAAFEWAVEEMDGAEFLSTVHEMVGDLVEDTAHHPPHPAPVPAGLVGFDSHPQQVDSVSGGYGGYVYLGEAAPSTCQGPLCDRNVTQSGQLYSQAGADSQGQYLPYHWPVDGIPTSAAAASYPAAPPHPYNQVPSVKLTNGYILFPVGTLNGEVVYDIATEVSASSDPAAPPPKTSMSKKGKRENQQHDGRQYVKKPPNAFMLFLKEQRANVVAGLTFTDSARVNAILGERWTLLSKEEKAKYYEEADRERRLHSQKYPDWSPTDNYGMKRKRNRRKAPTSSHLPPTCAAYLQDPPTAASTGLVSPAALAETLMMPQLLSSLYTDVFLNTF